MRKLASLTPERCSLDQPLIDLIRATALIVALPFEHDHDCAQQYIYVSLPLFSFRTNYFLFLFAMGLCLFIKICSHLM